MFSEGWEIQQLQGNSPKKLIEQLSGRKIGIGNRRRVYWQYKGQKRLVYLEASPAKEFPLQAVYQSTSKSKRISEREEKGSHH